MVELTEQYKNYELDILNLYLEAFPESERQDFSKIMDVIYKKRGRIITILKDKKFAGFFITLDSVNKKTFLIDYFAIKKQYRGMGLGSEAIRLLDNKETIIIEIEPVTEKAKNFTQRKKRLSFYKNLGFKEAKVKIKWFDEIFDLLSLNKKINFESYKKLLLSFYPENEVNKYVRKITY